MAKHFTMSYPTLRYKARIIAAFVLRDIAEFAGYNVVAADVTSFLALVTAFENSPTDEDIVGDATFLTAQKEAKVKVIHSAIRKVLVRVSGKFGLQSVMYRRFAVGELSHIRDKEIDDAIRKITLAGTTYLDELESTGLTAGMLTSLSALGTDFQETQVLLGTNANARIKATEERENDANEIYAILSQWCGYGKEIWNGVSEAFHDGYIIYDADDMPLTPPDAPTGLQVDLVTLLLTWLAVAGATGYKVQIQYPAGSGTFVPAHLGVLNNTLQFQLTSPGGNFKVRVFANNAAGLSAPSAEFAVNFGLAAPGGFDFDAVQGKFTWVLVAGVTFYRMEASYDGGLTWNEVFASDFTVGEYGWSPPAGMFRIRAESGGQVSDWVYETVA